MGVKYKMQIDSVTVLDSDSTQKLIIDFEFDDDTENEIGEVTINAPQTINSTVTVENGQSVEIWRGFTTSTDEKIFSGRVAEIKPGSGLVKIIARNKLWNLVKKNVNKIYDEGGAQAGVISAIAQDLIETYGGLTASVVSTGTGDGKTIGQFKCLNTDIWERLQALKKAVDYQIKYDANTDTVNFEPRGYTDSGKTITVGTEILNLPDWDYDTSKLVNSLRVDGAVILTNLRFPTSGSGQIGTTANFTTTGITLPKTPEIVELYLDSSDPPTTIREGGTMDGSTGNYFYVDKENRQVIPVSGSTFATNDYAVVTYAWAAPVPIIIENETSIDALGGRPDGVFEKQLTFSDISSIADAESRATEYLARFSTPLLSAKVLIRNTESLDLKAGDLVTVVDNISVPNVNRTLVITKRVIKFPGDVEELYLGDAALRMGDWNMQTEERIKRLEEELIRNQDLVVNLVQSNLVDPTDNNASKQYVRYNIAYSQAYTTADNTMIWDNATNGIWNTDNWATDANPDGFDPETKVFVQSFDMGTVDKYVDYFTDSDFQDTGVTDATWGTNGQIAFTSGQIAQSLSIDLNNGTITGATITFEGSGTYDVYLSADGGSNFEAVDLGLDLPFTLPASFASQAHTFSNTGTDLRWKIVESGGSTGTINSVTVSGYH